MLGKWTAKQNMLFILPLTTCTQAVVPGMPTPTASFHIEMVGWQSESGEDNTFVLEYCRSLAIYWVNHQNIIYSRISVAARKLSIGLSGRFITAFSCREMVHLEVSAISTAPCSGLATMKVVSGHLLHLEYMPFLFVYLAHKAHTTQYPLLG